MRTNKIDFIYKKIILDRNKEIAKKLLNNALNEKHLKNISIEENNTLLLSTYIKKFPSILNDPDIEFDFYYGLTNLHSILLYFSITKFSINDFMLVWGLSRISDKTGNKKFLTSL